MSSFDDDFRIPSCSPPVLGGGAQWDYRNIFFSEIQIGRGDTLRRGTPTRGVPMISPPCDLPDDLKLSRPEQVPYKNLKTVKEDIDDDVDDYTVAMAANMLKESGREMFAETVIHKDDRIRISPCDSQPYRWICFLECHSASGAVYQATGFFVTMASRPGVILTTAHNLYFHKDGGYATYVDIFPGRDGDRIPFKSFRVYNTNIRVLDDYKQSKTARNDYGVIVIPPEQLGSQTKVFGFGYKLLSTFDVKNEVAEICGYAGDKPDATLWIAGGPIKIVTSNRLYYQTDTSSGQSGSPVFLWSDFNWMVVGIHGKGVLPGYKLNSARRITADFVRQVYTWIQEIDTGEMVSPDR